MKPDSQHPNPWPIFLVVVGLCLALAAPARAAGPQSSADYVFTVESIDGGGLRAASADYTSAGSFGAGNFMASADYNQRGGYVGQLPNPPVVTNYPITITTNTAIKVPIAALLSAASDPDGDALSFVSVTATSAQNGAASASGNWLFYQPPINFTGSDSLTWIVQSSEGDQNTGIISVQVSAPPPPSNQPTLNLISITFNTAPDSTDATLRFASLPGLSYTVQYTDSLQPPVTWTTLGTATTTNGQFQIVDPTARNASQRYYRTIVQTQ